MKNNGKTSREMDKFVVRLPDGLRDRIAARAAANHRSMNGEIIAVLLGSERSQGRHGGVVEPTGIWHPTVGMVVMDFDTGEYLGAIRSFTAVEDDVSLDVIAHCDRGSRNIHVIRPYCVSLKM